jgi:integration host factor subunit alpha
MMDGSDSATTLTKAELAERLFERIGLTKRECKALVDAFFDVLAQRLIAGEDVRISGFGQFLVRNKPPRPGRNPRTGQVVPIAARRVVTFHASPKLKAALQAGDANANAPD